MNLSQHYLPQLPSPPPFYFTFHHISPLKTFLHHNLHHSIHIFKFNLLNHKQIFHHIINIFNKNTIIKTIYKLHTILSPTISQINQTNILFSKINSPKFIKIIITLKNIIYSIKNISNNKYKITHFYIIYY